MSVGDFYRDQSPLKNEQIPDFHKTYCSSLEKNGMELWSQWHTRL